MSREALLFAGYAGVLLAAAIALEWLSAHTHRRSWSKSCGHRCWPSGQVQ